MNEDEAIKRLKEILDFKKNTIDKIEDPIEREIEENCYIEEMPFKAIEIILDLYKQKKEENKELSEELTERICKNVEAEEFEKMRIELKQEKEKIEAMNKGIDELTREKQDLKTELYINSVSKEKIRAKIKELEEKSDYWNCDEIEVLKELLED